MYRDEIGEPPLEAIPDLLVRSPEDEAAYAAEYEGPCPCNNAGAMCPDCRAAYRAAERARHNAIRLARQTDPATQPHRDAAERVCAMLVKAGFNATAHGTAVRIHTAHESHRGVVDGIAQKASDPYCCDVRMIATSWVIRVKDGRAAFLRDRLVERYGDDGYLDVAVGDRWVTLTNERAGMKPLANAGNEYEDAAPGAPHSVHGVGPTR